MSFLKSLTTVSVFMTLSLSAYANSVHGVFKVVKGKVFVVDKSGKQTKARIGLKIFPQSTIKTGKDSRAKVVMTDQNEINVSPESVVELSKYEFDPKADNKNVLINVIYGKIRSKVSQKYEGGNKFQVKTPSAVAGVRGTDFITSFDKGRSETKIITFEGRVEFGIPAGSSDIANSVFVSMGQTSTLTTGSRPSLPIELPATELAEFDFESNAEPKGRPFEGREPADSTLEPKEDGLMPPPDDSAMLEPDRNPDSVDDGSLLPPPPPPPDDTSLVINEPLPQAPPPLEPVKTCDFCREVIESGNRRLIINVTHGP